MYLQEANASAVERFFTAKYTTIATWTLALRRETVVSLSVTKFYYNKRSPSLVPIEGSYTTSY